MTKSTLNQLLANLPEDAKVEAEFSFCDRPYCSPYASKITAITIAIDDQGETTATIKVEELPNPEEAAA